MKSVLLFTLCLCALAVPAWATDFQPANSACLTVSVNLQGSAGAGITVDATSGGVTVMAANAKRCGAIITNYGAADIRCVSSTQTPTATVGYPVPAGQSLRLGLEGQQAYKCIRTTGTSAEVDVIEAVP